MAHEGTPEPAMEAEERHQVDRGQGDAGELVDIGAIGRVEAEGDHGVGEEIGVGLAGTAVAVLVGLDLDDRGLRPAAEAGDGPGVGVRFLALVGRPVRRELPDVLEGALLLDVRGQRPAARGVEQAAERRGDRGGRSGGDGPDVGAEGGLVAVLEISDRPQQVRLPFPGLVHPGHAAVVELVGDVEGEVHVVTHERVVVGAGQGAQRPRLAEEAMEQRLGQSSTRRRQRRGAVMHERYLPRGPSGENGRRSPSAPDRLLPGCWSPGQPESG